MIERCERPSHIGFKYYGGRDIKVCARWRNSFEAFLADMGPKPSSKHTIDRIETNGDYEPKNCRWALPREQRLNQRPYDESKRVLRAWETRSRISKTRLDLTGIVFGRLTVLNYAGTKKKETFWFCKCECGNQKEVSKKALRSGGTKSCGCLCQEVASKNTTKRNLKHARDYANKRWSDGGKTWHGKG